MWWSFEAPDLTRNPKIKEIIVVPADADYAWNPVPDPKNLYGLEQSRVTWRQGDPPLGTPGDPLREATMPNAP